MFENKKQTQNIKCSVLLNLYWIYIYEHKFVQHGPITIAIDCNVLYLLIFEERWPTYASGPKSAPNRTQKQTPNIECSFGCVARSAVLLKPNVVNIFRFNFYEQKFKNKTRKQWLVLGAPAFQYMCAGFFVPQMRQFCLFTYPPRSKLVSSEIWFFFTKISIFWKSIASEALFKRIHNHIRSAEG